MLSCIIFTNYIIISLHEIIYYWIFHTHLLNINIFLINNNRWTSITSYESEKEQQDRVKETLTFLRYEKSNLPILVGHSLFFKAFYSKRISDSLDKNKPELSHQMKRYRLNNASILAVTVQFNNSDKSDGLCDGEIIDADG